MTVPNTQSWWDAACNCNPKNMADLVDTDVLSDNRYEIYTKIRNDSGIDNHEVASSTNMNPEERFMYILFLHHSNME